MTTYTFGAYDYSGHQITIAITAATRIEAIKAARGICEASRRWIDCDEGLYIIDERPYT